VRRLGVQAEVVQQTPDAQPPLPEPLNGAPAVPSYETGGEFRSP